MIQLLNGESRRGGPAVGEDAVTAASVEPDAAAQAGNGGMRGPGVLKVISVMALTLRLP